MYKDYIGKHKNEIDTPALLLDMDIAERNIHKMAEFFRNRDCKLRPHMKTHKLPLIAHKQLEAGAIGITCAKLGEAKVFLESGIKDILIANQIVGKDKITRLVNLSGYGNIVICVDDNNNARDISEIAGKYGKKINILIEVNVGLNRCGVEPGEKTLALLKKIDCLNNLVFCGLMGYEGGLFISDIEKKRKVCMESNSLLVDTARLIEKEGFPVKVISAGGSNTYGLTGIYPGITEIQAGSYVTMDTHNRSYGLDFEMSVTILSSIISMPEKNRAIIDAGKKSLSTDEGLPECRDERASIFLLNEEHGHIRLKDSCDKNFSIGDKIEIFPSHGCTTIPLFDRYFIIRDGYVESCLEIYARGENQ